MRESYYTCGGNVDTLTARDLNILFNLSFFWSPKTGRGENRAAYKTSKPFEKVQHGTISRRALAHLRRAKSGRFLADPESSAISVDGLEVDRAQRTGGNDGKSRGTCRLLAGREGRSETQGAQRNEEDGGYGWLHFVCECG